MINSLVIVYAGGYGTLVINNAPVVVQMAKGGVADDLVTIPCGMVTSTVGPSVLYGMPFLTSCVYTRLVRLSWQR